MAAAGALQQKKYHHPDAQFQGKRDWLSAMKGATVAYFSSFEAREESFDPASPSGRGAFG